MGRYALSRPGSKHRSITYRLTLEELEKRLPPGDMIGLSGTALWGMSLGMDGPGLRIAPTTLSESPNLRPDADSATARPAPHSTTTQISLVPGSLAATDKAAGLTAAPAAKPDLADYDLFHSGLISPFDVPQPARPNPRGLSQGGVERANQTDLLRGPMPGGGGDGSRGASSAEAPPQPPNSTTPSSFPPMSAGTANPSKQTKAATASTMPAPANSVATVVSSAQGTLPSNTGGTSGPIINPYMPETDTPPRKPT
jgi:hypothetical protein